MKHLEGAFHRNFGLNVLCKGMVLATLLAIAAQAQSYHVLYNFTGGQDGADPYAGVTLDAGGNLYGTTITGRGQSANGTVFKLERRGSGWIFNTLYAFSGGNDGASPTARVELGPDGALYGTTQDGGGHSGCPYGHTCGTVFSLSSPATFCHAVRCPWIEKVIYSFTGGADGGNPGLGDLIFDNLGNMYGTTIFGGNLGGVCGSGGCGVVFKLTPSGGGWNESAIYRFSGSDGLAPENTVEIDSSGDLYGTTAEGGSDNNGTVFQLTPSGPGWTETVLHSFNRPPSEGFPWSNVILDAAGNLYGATGWAGTGGGGVVFELARQGNSWMYSVLYSLTGGGDFTDGPQAGLVMDAAGNLYGTTAQDGAYSYGNVFKLTPSGGGWTYTSLYDFSGYLDGAEPVSTVAIDAQGNLYGTTSSGGSHDYGVVWEITP